MATYYGVKLLEYQALLLHDGVVTARLFDNTGTNITGSQLIRFEQDGDNKLKLKSPISFAVEGGKNIKGIRLTARGRTLMDLPEDKTTVAFTEYLLEDIGVEV